MIHPIVDYKALFPKAFNDLLLGYFESIEKYKHGSWVCNQCESINVLYYSSESESYKTVKDGKNDRVQRNCESCGSYYGGEGFSHFGKLRK